MAGDDRMHARRGLARNRGVLSLLVVAAAVVALTAGPVFERPAGTGSIRGIVGLTGEVAFGGTAPVGTPIDLGGDAYCEQANAGRQLLDRAVLVDADGNLANVVVYISQGVPAGAHATPAEPVVLDQQNCVYVPRVLALQAGQDLVIRNSDQTLHNVHVRAQNNREFNIGQPLKGIESRRRFTNAEVGITVSCDVHGWMHGRIAVFDHPYHAVSGEDGSFSIDALPAGDYVVEAWHETLGVREQRVTVTAGETASVTFTFEGS